MSGTLLSRADIIDALTELVRELRADGRRSRIQIVGGAAIALTLTPVTSSGHGSTLWSVRCSMLPVQHRPYPIRRDSLESVDRPQNREKRCVPRPCGRNEDRR